MWSPDPRPIVVRCAALARSFGVTVVLAALLAGCFQPLYGEKTLDGGNGLRQRLASVTIDSIYAPRGSPQARIAVELQNALSFEMTGGTEQPAKTHVLKVQLTTQGQQVIVDINTARSEVQQFGINASFTLVEVASGKTVVSGQTFSRVSYDNPGQQQRFAGARGQRDAEDRAAKVISDNIKSRLASYFAAGA